MNTTLKYRKCSCMYIQNLYSLILEWLNYMLKKNRNINTIDEIKNDILKSYNLIIDRKTSTNKYHIVISNPDLKIKEKRFDCNKELRTFNFLLTNRLLNKSITRNYCKSSYLYVLEYNNLDLSNTFISNIDTHCHLLIETPLKSKELMKIIYEVFYQSLDSVYEKNITRNNYVEKWKDELFIEDITRRSDIRTLSGYFIKQSNNFTNLNYNYKIF